VQGADRPFCSIGSEHQEPRYPASIKRALPLQQQRRLLLPELAACSALADLCLDGNQLKAAPLPAETLSRLTLLDLRCNQLRALPEHLGSLRACEVLDASRNPVLQGSAAEAASRLLRGCTRLRRLGWQQGGGCRGTVCVTALSDAVRLQQALVRSDGSMADLLVSSPHDEVVIACVAYRSLALTRSRFISANI